LRLLARSCDYKDPQEAIRDILVLQMRDEKAREKILDKSQLDEKVPDLDQIVGMLKNYEARKHQYDEWNKPKLEDNIFKLNKAKPELK